MICKLCPNEVTSGDPSRYPYCKWCHYGGAAGADLRKDQIAKFKGAFPGAEVGIDHTGGGCFWLSIRWDNDPVFYVLTDGEASLPSDDEGFPIADGWGYVGRHADDEEPAEDAPQEEWDLFYGIPLYYDEEFTINDNLAIDYILRDRAERKETANA